MKSEAFMIFLAKEKKIEKIIFCTFIINSSENFEEKYLTKHVLLRSLKILYLFVIKINFYSHLLKTQLNIIYYIFSYTVASILLVCYRHMRGIPQRLNVLF